MILLGHLNGAKLMGHTSCSDNCWEAVCIIIWVQNCLMVANVAPFPTIFHYLSDWELEKLLGQIIDDW